MAFSREKIVAQISIAYFDYIENKAIPEAILSALKAEDVGVRFTLWEDIAKRTSFDKSKAHNCMSCNTYYLHRNAFVDNVVDYLENAENSTKEK